MSHNGAVVELTTWTGESDRWPVLSDFSKLTDAALRRVKEPAGGLYIAESHMVIRRALDAGHQLRAVVMAHKWLDSSGDILQAAAAQGVPVFVAADDVLEALTGFHLHRGALASMHRPQLPDWRDLTAGARRVVVLEDVVEHTNVGAIFRACAAFGADAVLVSPRCADPLYRRSIRVSVGTVFQVPWTRFDAWPDGLTALAASGFTVAGLALSETSVSLDEFESCVPDRLALVLGTEGEGLRPETLARCSSHVRIPMHGGVDSLNVAAAASVALWATRRSDSGRI